MDGKIRIDFQVIEVTDPYILFLTDTSNWVYAEDKPAFVEIRLPASRKFKRYAWKKMFDNLFNSHNLGITCLKGGCLEEDYVELPDGIYEIKLISAYEGINKTKFHLRTVLFDIEYYKTLINIGEYRNLTEEQKEYFVRINYTMERAKAYTLIGDGRQADFFYREAKNTLEKLNCNNC